MRLEREDFSLSDLIQDVFQKFELMAETRHSKLLAVLPRGASMVSADLGMIERVLTNLIDNALRHTPEGGSIEVALVHEPGKVRVTVSDTGPGIPPKLLENLFRRPFNQDGERRSGGLGLLIVRRILQLHDSQIRLLSMPGTTEIYTLSLHDALPICSASSWRPASDRRRGHSRPQAGSGVGVAGNRPYSRSVAWATA